MVVGTSVMGRPIPDGSACCYRRVGRGATMRVISWNMGCAMAAYRPSHDEAWRYLVDELRPDLALVQETLLTPSVHLGSRGRLSARGAWSRTKDWGSAVYAPTLPIEDVTTIDTEGVHACSTTITTAEGPLVAVSLHVSTVDDQSARLAAVADGLATVASAQRMIIAGDFNAARRFDEVYPGMNYGKFFERMREVGFFECHWRLHGREVQTFWGKQTIEAYQDDHFFVNEDLGAKVTSCSAIDNAVVRRLSDHAPLELVIDL